MAKLGVKQIQVEAQKIIRSEPGGIRYSQLVTRIQEAHPETPRNTINGSTWNLDKLYPNEITKPSRGLFKSAAQEEVVEAVEESTVALTPSGQKVRET